MRLATTKIIERRDLTPELMIMKFEKPPDFTFIPGQYCTVGIDGIERPYSMVSAPHEPFIELFFELVPASLRTDKSLTPLFWKLGVGDSVTIRSKAKGLLTLDTKFRVHVMIATVAGIAPFVSIIRSSISDYYGTGFIKPLVFHGASGQDEFGYDGELGEHHRRGKIIYIPTVSRPDEPRNHNWRGLCGRVNSIIETYLRLYFIRPANTLCYLCGNQGMIDELGNTKPKPEKPIGKLIRLKFATREEVFF